MKSAILNEDSVIEIGKSVPISAYRKFFEERAEKDLSGWDFQSWLNMQAGKTLKEAMEDLEGTGEPKGMKDLLSENRFHIISEPDKAFILDFDDKIKELGYDFGGGIGDGYYWGKFMIVYAKTGVKTKKVIARIYIREDSIILRLFLNNVDKHTEYIENAPEHIKEAFVGPNGNCSCNPKKENCRMRKTYVMDDRLIEKCGGVIFEFWNPTVEKCQDYIDLLKEFYPVKKSKRM